MIHALATRGALFTPAARLEKVDWRAMVDCMMPVCLELRSKRDASTHTKGLCSDGSQARSTDLSPLPSVVVEQPEVLQEAQKEKQQPSGTDQHTFDLPNVRGEVP